MEDQDTADLCFPQLLNASCRKPNISQSKAGLLYLMLLLILSVFSVVLNMFVVISVSHFRQLHTPTNLLVLSLAVSDFLFGLVVTPMQAREFIACWLLGDLMCSLYIYVISIILGASIGNMILISVDRYVAICDPLHYPTSVTVTRVRMCVCMCWTCSVVYNGLILQDFLTHPGHYRACYGQCVGGTDSISGIVDNILTSIAPVTVIILLYMRVFVTAVSQVRAMRSHVAAITLQHSETVMTKKSELKAARTLGVVILVFVVCFCPFYSLLFVPANSPGLPTLLSYFLLHVNPCLNPVIYALFYPWFRKAIKLIFSLQILQPGSCETNML